MELFLFLMISIPWIIFSFTAQYISLKDDKENKKIIFSRMILEIVIIIIFGFLFVYLSKEYDKYLVFALVLTSIITTYLKRN
ncbi:MAG: hypothetical protein ACQERJ_06955 [Bacillota bacterium]